MEDANEAGGKTDRNPLASHWDTFRSWHVEVSFWREAYAQMIAALASATVIYLVAAIAGLVSTAPLTVVGIAIVGVTTPFLVYWLVDMIAHWKNLRMSQDWSLTPPRSPDELRIRRVYIRALPIGCIWLFGLALIVIARLAR